MPDFDYLELKIEPETPTGSLAWLNQTTTLETPETLEHPRKHRRRARRRSLRAIRQEALEEFFTELPEPGESIHFVSNGRFDYWNFVPATLRLMNEQHGNIPAVFYGSTWTMNRSNVLQLLNLYDQGKLAAVTMLSGLYFKRREPAVYTALADGFIDRGQRFLCFENHTKIMLIAAGDYYITIEGSANFTYNPRLEQNCVTNDAGLFEFHRAWMEELLAKCKTKTQN